MNGHEIFINMINDNLKEMGDTIDCLYTTSNSCVKNKLLNRLRRNMSNLSMLIQGLRNDASTNSPQPNADRLFALRILTASLTQC
jgi:hypothetical protein